MFGFFRFVQEPSLITKRFCKLHVGKVGEYVVLDRINVRFGNRVDLAMGKRQHDRAVKFGVQRLNVTQGWD